MFKTVSIDSYNLPLRKLCRALSNLKSAEGGLRPKSLRTSALIIMFFFFSLIEV